jgi:cytochrome c2
MIRTWLETIAAILAAGAAVVAVTAVLHAGNQDTRRRIDESMAQTGGDPNRGSVLMARLGCGSCHEIPGVDGARGRVGPSLAGFGERVFIGGVAENTTENLTRWLIDPRALSARTAMPALGLDQQGARDIAAWLYINARGS